MFTNAQWASDLLESKKDARKSKVIPIKRWGHSTVIYKNKMILFGGKLASAKVSKHSQTFFRV